MNQRFCALFWNLAHFSQRPKCFFIHSMVSEVITVLEATYGVLLPHNKYAVKDFL